MKAIVLAAGYGKRLRPHTHYGPKQMLPIANKPVLEYVIDQVRDAGIRDVCLVIGEESDAIRDYLADGSSRGLSITYIFQEHRLGIAHAVSLCETWVGGSPFVLILGDNIFRTPLKDILSHHEKNKDDVTLCLTEVTNPQDFGVAEMNGGKIVRIVEKPKNPPSNLAVVGTYVFRDPSRVFDVIHHLSPSARGEYEITDALQKLLESGVRLGTFTVARWKDTGKPEDLLEANRMVLEDLVSDIKGKSDAVISGPTSIGKGSVVSGKIIGPVIIGDNCTIQDCVLGPFVSIGNGTTLKSVRISDSIIMADTSMDAPWTLQASIIGNNCAVESKTPVPRIKLALGDHTRIQT